MTYFVLKYLKHTKLVFLKYILETQISLLLFLYLCKNCFLLFSNSRKKHVASTAGIFDTYFMHFDALIYLIRCGGNIFETGVTRVTYFGLVS
jgi:hypothetical protein